MPAQPTDLAQALESALSRVLAGREFQVAVNDYVTARERIEPFVIGSSNSANYNVELELTDEYSGRTETFRLVIDRVREPSPLAAVLKAA